MGFFIYSVVKVLDNPDHYLDGGALPLEAVGSAAGLLFWAEDRLFAAAFSRITL
jgi:hypothetical protein